MKKLILFFSAVLLTAISANVFAQGTGTAPEIGSEHNYAVTFTSGNSYTWDVTSDVAGNTSIDGSLVTVAAGTNDANIDVTWDSPIPGTIYFIHVTETDATGCANRKVLAVTPVNNFTLDIVSVDLTDADTDNGETFEICAADISVDGYNSGTNSFTYNYHKDSVFYKIIADGINLDNTDWSPQFTIDHDDITGTAVTAGWATSISGTYTMGLSTDGTTVNDIDVPTTETTSGEIWIKVIIDNSTTNEGLTKNDITVNLVEDPDLNADDNNLSGEDENGNDVTSTGNDARTQTVKARPATTGIATD